MTTEASAFVFPEAVNREVSEMFRDQQNKPISHDTLEDLLRSVYELGDPPEVGAWEIPAATEERVRRVSMASGRKALSAILGSILYRDHSLGVTGPERWLLRLFRWFANEESLKRLHQAHRYIQAQRRPDFEPDRTSIVLRILMSSPHCDAWLQLFEVLRDDWIQPPATSNTAFRDLLAQRAEREGVASNVVFERSLPSLGLDRSGQVDVVMSRQKVTVKVPIMGEIRLLDAEGRRWEKPEGKSKAALEEKELANAVKVVVRDIERLHRSMATYLEHKIRAQASWTAQAWRSVFVEHPLWAPLARTVVWMTSAGQTFRMDESGECCDVEDNLVSHIEGEVSLMHPIRVTDATIHAWRARFAEYQILQPISQIERPYVRVGTDLVQQVQGILFSVNEKMWIEHGWWSRVGKPGTFVLAHSMAEKGFTARATITLSPSTKQKGELSEVELRETQGKEAIDMGRLDDFTYSEVWGHFLAKIRDFSAY